MSSGTGEGNETNDKPLGWSQSGKLTSNDDSGIVSLQAVFPESGDYTVQISLADNTQGVVAGQPSSVQAEALITWSVEGNNVRRRVTVVNGLTVQGTAQAVYVSVKDKSIGGFATPITYTVNIQVVPGTRASVQQPPTLISQRVFVGAVDTQNPTGYHYFVGPASSVNIPVPLDAGIISVFVTAFPNPVTVIPQNNAQVQHNGGAGIQKNYDPNVLDGWVPLLPGTSNITLFNNFAAATSIDFTVTFGIDG